MRPLRAEEIRGNWSTLLLPIREDSGIDFGALAEEINILIASGVDGIYSNGTAGEFYNQTEEEFDRISRLLAERCTRAAVAFQIGVSHMSPIISLARLQRIVELQPSAVQVILPDWVPAGNEEAISFLAKLAHYAGEIGLVLYNPPHAKRQLTPQDLATLKEAVPSLMGVKLPITDPQQMQEVKGQLPHVSIFVAGHALASCLRAGAYGAYSNVACLNPRGPETWTDQMYTDMDGALELEQRIQRFMNQQIRPYIDQHGFSNTAVDKLLACVGGWAPLTPRLRWPYRSIPQSEADRLRPEAKRLLPEFFAG